MISTRVFTSVVIRNGEGKLLIIRRVSGARFAPNQWEFVNGTIEPHETAEETAIREVLEETGIQIKIEQLTPSTIYEITDNDGRWIVIPFLAEIAGDNIHLSEEHSEYRWIDEQEVLTTPYVSDDYRALLRAKEQ